MYYPDDAIQELRARADIVDVVGRYVALKKSGSTYFGLCPFHGEKTPSFSVAPGKQIFYCFGCGKGGDVFRFLMEYENLGFSEAVQELAKQVGYQLPEPKEADPAARREKDFRAVLLEINKQAALYYYRLLRSPEGAPGLRYLRARALSEETIRHFGLGYAGQGGSLYRYLRGQGFADGALRESGLFSFSERGIRDKFFNRVIFPIMDQNSRVIGFGGRVMGQGEPKYLNSPETRLFDKSRNLFGLNFAKKAREKRFLLCEGYMDVISMHQAGFPFAVASLGTAFTEEQARLVKRYVSEVVLSYDSDGAGIKAAKRAIPMLLAEGLTPRVIKLEPCKDPDEFVKTQGKEAFQARLRNARNAFLWEAEVLKRDYDLKDPAGQTAYDAALARLLLERFPESMEREHYLKAVCREQMLDAEGMRRLMARQAERRVSLAGKHMYAHTSRMERFPASPEGRGGSPQALGRRGTGDSGFMANRKRESALLRSERQLIAWLSGRSELVPAAKAIVGAEDLSDPLYQEVLGKIYGGMDAPAILDSCREDEEKYARAAAVFNGDLLEEDAEGERFQQAFTDVVKNIRMHALEVQIRQETDGRKLQELLAAQAEIRAWRYEP